MLLAVVMIAPFIGFVCLLLVLLPPGCTTPPRPEPAKPDAAPVLRLLDPVLVKLFPPVTELLKVTVLVALVAPELVVPELVAVVVVVPGPVV